MIKARTAALEQRAVPGAAALALVSARGTWKDVRRRRMLAAADTLALAAGATAATLVEGELATALYVMALLPVWILVAKGCGLYDRDHVRILHRTVDEVMSLLHWATLSVALTGVAVALVDPDLVSLRTAAVLFAVTALAAIVLRGGARYLWRRIVPPEKGLVIGGGRLADAFARKVALEPGHHIALTRRIAFDGGTRGPLRSPVRRVDVDELREVIEGSSIERVVLAEQDLDEETLHEVVRCCRTLGVKLSVAPPLHAMFGTAVTLSRLAEFPLIEFRTWDPSRSTMFLKRTMDVLGSAAGLLVLAPFFAVVAIAIKLDTRGPVFFRQIRAGKEGAPFRMVKFRTMVDGASAQLGELIDVDELSEPVFKLRNDPRVTRVGRYLRRASLDELPQLLNVLKGDMSLVGPRPEEAWLVERYTDDERFRLDVPPGMTGPMQVHGRGELTFAERIAVEREYVEGYSLRRDVEILLQTVAVVVRGRGAF